ELTLKRRCASAFSEIANSLTKRRRSLKDLVAFLEHLRETKVELFLHQQGLDTTTSSGRAMFVMISVVAEFEHAMIQERVRAGMARAKAKGTRSGKPIGRPAIHPACGQPRRLRGWRDRPASHCRTVRCWCRGCSPLRRLRPQPTPRTSARP